MKKYESGAWLVMSGLLATLILVVSPNLTMVSVFMTPLIRYFHWSHADVGHLAFAAGIAGGLVSPLVGWLLDRIGARWLIAAGVAIMGVSYLVASHSQSLGAMTLAWGVVGIGAAVAGLIPIMVVAINWFGGRRGFAGGVIMFGMGVGMALPPPILTYLIAHHGWRVAMRWMAVPALAIAVPYVLAVMRTRPKVAQARNTSEEVASLPGLEVGAALCSSAFWLCLIADFIWSSGFSASLTHSITYMIGLGFKPSHAALIYSAQTMGTALCTVPFGILADRIGVRRVLALAFLLVGIGSAALVGFSSTVAEPYLLPVYILCWGAPCGTVFALLPVLMAETLGLRRLGTLVGIKGFSTAVALATGPVWSGKLFDITGSYVLPYEIATIAILANFVIILMVRPARGYDQVPLREEKSGLVAAAQA
ncbi:MAG TPA: MFS transporter [Candidatus Binataceae bacterium]|nr:MFS transporter [Candidatus Binataceae bacterium]